MRPQTHTQIRTSAYDGSTRRSSPTVQSPIRSPTANVCLLGDATETGFGAQPSGERCPRAWICTYASPLSDSHSLPASVMRWRRSGERHDPMGNASAATTAYRPPASAAPRSVNR